jgi:hypothetical protein
MVMLRLVYERVDLWSGLATKYSVTLEAEVLPLKDLAHRLICIDFTQNKHTFGSGIG